MIKGSMFPKNITIPNTYVSDNRATKYMKLGWG
jgi:hypothetical protein